MRRGLELPQPGEVFANLRQAGRHSYLGATDEPRLDGVAQGDDRAREATTRAPSSWGKNPANGAHTAVE